MIATGGAKRKLPDVPIGESVPVRIRHLGGFSRHPGAGGISLRVHAETGNTFSAAFRKGSKEGRAVVKMSSASLANLVSGRQGADVINPRLKRRVASRPASHVYEDGINMFARLAYITIPSYQRADLSVSTPRHEPGCEASFTPAA